MNLKNIKKNYFILIKFIYYNIVIFYFMNILDDKNKLTTPKN